MTVYQFRQSHRFENLNLVAPDAEMPSHLQIAAGTEPHNQGAIHLPLKRLGRMEYKVGGDIGGIGSEPPHDIEWLLLKQPEGAGGETLQIEGGIPNEAVHQQIHSFDAGQAEQDELFCLRMLMPSN